MVKHHLLLFMKGGAIMDEVTLTKTTVVSLFAYIAARLEAIGPIFQLLLLSMLIDWFTGILQAIYHHTLSSRHGMWGIIKKILYCVVIAIGLSMDWLILVITEHLGVELPIRLFFGLLVSIWFIFNEFISILENLTKMEIMLPSFLMTIVKTFKKYIENHVDEQKKII